jgi:REP element-mobilizing transposase RayT
MVYDPAQHHRRSIRLAGFDYRQRGAYFVTICTRHRQCVFGTVMNDAVQLSQRGRIVDTCWLDIPNHHTHVELDEFVIMPNHVHAILWLLDTQDGRATRASPLHARPVGATPASPSPRPRGPVPQSLGGIIGSFKSAVSRNINRVRPGAANDLWQPNYYEHVIRIEDALAEIRYYIQTNPQRWCDDAENAAGTGRDQFAEFLVTLEKSIAQRKKGDAGVAPTGQPVLDD